MLDSEFAMFVVSFFLLMSILEMANIYYYLYLQGNRALGDWNAVKVLLLVSIGVGIWSTISLILAAALVQGASKVLRSSRSVIAELCVILCDKEYGADTEYSLPILVWKNFCFCA